jgi:hypothetical protein
MERKGLIFLLYIMSIAVFLVHCKFRNYISLGLSISVVLFTFYILNHSYIFPI